MRKSIITFAQILLTGISFAYAQSAPAAKVILAGDSTCRTNKESEYPRAGWGQYLEQELGNGTQVLNLAVGGRSTKSFITKGHWAKVMGKCCPGDVVVIQFGHNDASSKPEKHTVLDGSSTEEFEGVVVGNFQSNLERMVNDVKAKGGIPILSTSTCTRHFDSEGHVKPSVPGYVQATREVAARLEVPLIDINELTREWLEGLGKEDAEPYFVTNKLDPAKVDNSHLSHAGAQVVAHMVADGLRDLGFCRRSVSILGDSYSTYEGRIPKGNAVWYKEPANLSSTDVTSVDQTWWSLLVKECGYSLVVNDSYSGATVSFTGYHQKDYADRSFITRLPRLGDPDIILIFGCTNDSWAGVEAGEFKYTDIRREDLYTYRPALAWLLEYAKMLYPEKAIYFILNDGLREDITESTLTICDHYGIPVIQLSGIDKMAGHPTVLGMQQIAAQVKAGLAAAN